MATGMKLLVGGVLLLLVAGGLFWLFASSSTTTQSVTQVQGAPPGTSVALACQGKSSVIEDTTVYFNVKDAINQTTSPDINATPQLNGAERPTISNINAGGNFEASPGDGYIIHLREDTSVDTGSNDYYYEVVRGNIPCEGTYTVQKLVGKEGAINVRIYNDDGVLTTATTQQAVSSGIVRVHFRIDGNTVDTFWGNPSIENPNGALFLVDTNKSVIENIEVANAPSNPNQPIPETYSNLHGADTRVYSFELPGLKSLKETDSYEFDLIIDPVDDFEPAAFPSDDLNFTFYDSTAFPDDATGGYTWGWWDTDGTGTNIGATNETAFLALS